MEPSGSASTVFILLVLIMALVSAAALRATASRADGFPASRLGVFLGFAYLLIPALLASSGALTVYEPVPRPLLVIGAITAATFVVAFSDLGAKLADSIGLAALVGFQAFRVPVELILHRLGTEQTIPEVMTYSGRNFDIVTGLSAAVLGLLLLRRSLPRGLVLAWNVMGLLLLANIVVIAALSTPVRFQVFAEGPPNLLPGTFPYIWLPTFLVQLALLGHVLVFRKLSRRSRSSIRSDGALEPGHRAPRER